MKRLCYVIPTLHVGGSERQLLLLAEGLRNAFEITVVCTRALGPLADTMRGLGVHVQPLHLSTAWDPRMGMRLRRLFRQHRPDIVHTFLSGFDLAANRAARDTGVPVVLSSRRELAIWQKPRHLRRQRLANRYVDAIVANSHAAAAVAREREGGDPRLYRVIHNGIHADAFQSLADPESVREEFAIPHGRKVVVTVANFSPVKDYPLFFATAAKIASQYRDVHFVIVGSGPLAREIDRLVTRHGLEKRTAIVHTVDRVADLLAAADVFLLCSKAEGFPNAVMEAMAAARPIVARAVGGIPELVEDGLTGRLIPDRSPEAMAAAAVELLRDEPLAAAYAAASARRVRNLFAVEKMTAAYKALYSEFLAAGARVVG